MITIACFSHQNLVEKELIDAFKRVPEIRITAIEITAVTTEDQAVHVCKILKKLGCNMLLTINNWGLDKEGLIGKILQKNHIIHLNWNVDDPFFFEILNDITFPPFSNRFDFVTDRGYVQQMRDRGYNAHFLPLAADTNIFHQIPEKRAHKRDLCFVGNSYRKEMDKLLTNCHTYIESFLPDLTPLLQQYSENMQYDIESKIEPMVNKKELPPDLKKERAVFILKHFIGYLFRKNLVVSLVRTFPDFMVFGDKHWVQDIALDRVSMGVGYYKNLNVTYQQTRINIDINRMVIRDGFTQRVFDCLATNSFIITSPKKVVNDFFVTEGDSKELVVFQNREHLIELIQYYLRHEEERIAIAERGMKKVLALHTYDHRIKTALKIVSDYIQRK